MIYYNESLALNEAGFDVVDALIECPIYDKYESMIESISTYGFMNESEKIEFKVLQENVFETIGKALKKAWDAIAGFFGGLVERIKKFFGHLSMKKLKSAVDQKIKKEEEVINKAPADTKLRIIKKLGIKADSLKYLTEKNDKGEYTNYAFLNTDILVQQTINSNGLKNIRKSVDVLDKVMENNMKDIVKSNEQADKEIKKLDNLVKVDEKSIKTVLIGNGEIKNKVQSLIDVSKIRSFFYKTDEGDYIIGKQKKAMADYIYELSNANLTNNNNYAKMAKEYKIISENVGKNMEKDFKAEKSKSPNGYTNKVMNATFRKMKEITKFVNIDMHGMNQLVGAMLKAYKDDYALLIKIGSQKQIDTFKTDKVIESYDPWAGLEESNDPWAGLEESYDPWAGLE